MTMCISVLCMWLMLICIAIVEGKIQWKVERKVAGYGHDLVLFCEVKDCCIEHAGWSVDKTPIILDVRHFIQNSKYDAGINRNGFSLMIKRITKDDLNKTYFCTHGFEDSTKHVLVEDDAFLSPGQDGGKEDSNTVPLIIGVCVGVIVIVIVTSILGYIWRKRRKDRRQNRGNEGPRLRVNPEGTYVEFPYMRVKAEGKEAEEPLLRVNPEGNEDKTPLVRGKPEEIDDRLTVKAKPAETIKDKKQEFENPQLIQNITKP